MKRDHDFDEDGVPVNEQVALESFGSIELVAHGDADEWLARQEAQLNGPNYPENVTKDLLGKDIEWPEAREMDAETFADEVVNIILEHSDCEEGGLIEQIAVKICRELRGGIELPAGN